MIAETLNALSTVKEGSVVRADCAVLSTSGEGMLDKAIEELSVKKVVVLGLGVSGASSARFLLKCGATVVLSDRLPVDKILAYGPLAELGAKYVSYTETGRLLDGADMVVASPGVPGSDPALIMAEVKGIEVVSDIELASRYITAPIIAVAGTNGKSTVVTLLDELLKADGKSLFTGGNIGLPVSEYFELETTPDFCLLEVSSFQLEHIIRFKPDIAVLLNITEDHLERYKNFDGYAATKLGIFVNQGVDCLAVVNAGDPRIASILSVRGAGFEGHPPNAPRVVPFTTTGTLGDGLYLRDSGIVFAGIDAGDGEVYSTDECTLKGLHNVENMMAAIAVARLCKVDKRTVEQVLKSFKGLSHRMEFVRTLDGVTYIDDSKGTNIGALKMALKSIDAPVVLIAGGVDKGGDYSVLLPFVKEGVHSMVLIGESKEKMKGVFETATEVIEAATMESAVSAAFESAGNGMVVLLCPAGASFDMFSGYSERGDCFASCVRALESKRKKEVKEKRGCGDAWEFDTGSGKGEE